jgi:hypothetical protein
MNYIKTFFNGPQLSDERKLILSQLPPQSQEALKTKPLLDQERLLDTYQDQSEERRGLINSILAQQPLNVQLELFKKETRLLRAFLKTDIDSLRDGVHQADYIETLIMKKTRELDNL